MGTGTGELSLRSRRVIVYGGSRTIAELDMS